MKARRLLAAAAAIWVGATAGLPAADKPLQRIGTPVPPAHVGYLNGKGEVTIVGYADMKELLESWDAKFAAAHPGFHFALVLSGTRAAPAALARGSSALAPMGAEFTARQLSEYRAAAGRLPVAIRVARASLSARAKSGPLVVVVNAASPVRALSPSEVEAVFTLGRVGDRPVPLVGLAPETVLGEFMRERILGGRPFAPGFRAFAQSDAVARAVAADPTAIGFARINVVTGQANLRVVASYERFLYLYLRDVNDAFVREYVRLALSPLGQEAVAHTPQEYRPLTPAQRAEELAKLPS